VQILDVNGKEGMELRGWGFFFFFLFFSLFSVLYMYMEYNVFY